MFLLPLASISFGWKVFVVLWTLLAAALILIVLIQKGRGGGIGAAFGGGGSSSLLGTKTGDFLTWVTICFVALFLLGAIVMGKYMRPPEPLLPTPPTEAQPPLTAPEVPFDPDTEPEPAEQDIPDAGQDAAEPLAPGPEVELEPEHD